MLRQYFRGSSCGARAYLSLFEDGALLVFLGLVKSAWTVSGEGRTLLFSGPAHNWVLGRARVAQLGCGGLSDRSHSAVLDLARALILHGFRLAQNPRAVFQSLDQWEVDTKGNK